MQRNVNYSHNEMLSTDNTWLKLKTPIIQSRQEDY